MMPTIMNTTQITTTTGTMTLVIVSSGEVESGTGVVNDTV